MEMLNLNTAEALRCILSTYGVYLIVLLVVGGGFLFVDIHHKPRWILRYKIQKGKNAVIDKKKLSALFRNIALNSFVVLLPSSFILYLLLKWRGANLSFTPPPQLSLFLNILVFVILEEIGFYYFHRLLHTSYLYKRVHKTHHEWTAPIGLTAVYCHPFEMILSNLIPFLAGPVLMGSDLVTNLVWFTLAFTVTIIHHSGYHLPFLPSPEFHDFHHLKFVGNYGVLGILDRLHSTDEQFKGTSNHTRHRVIFSYKAFTT